jgi:aromatic ring-opening dioxygenase catalytic subunit (LigB family)
MTRIKLPTYFISHGGGPWPWMEDRLRDYERTAQWLKELPATLPQAPKAILSVSGHWEKPCFTVATSAHPPMVYDYYNFPPHTYRVTYPAPGSPELATRVRDLLSAAGIPVREDPERGFDHGTFVPLALMYPNADVPVVSLSVRSDLNARDHINMGAVLAPLRQEGVLIVGSGLSYHNLRAMFSDPTAGAISDQFEAWLTAAVSDPNPQSRADLLSQWSTAPAAREAHPREDHLIPLMVAAGAAADDVGGAALRDRVWGISLASYRFG